MITIAVNIPAGEIVARAKGSTPVTGDTRTTVGGDTRTTVGGDTRTIT